MALRARRLAPARRARHPLVAWLLAPLLGAGAGLAPLVLAGAACAEPPAARAPQDGPRARAVRSFDRFAASWMEKMERAEAANRRDPRVESSGDRTVVTYRGYAEGFDTELRATESSRAPYVGLLRYQEIVFRCADRSASSCRPAKRSPVTEIFRFQDGRWVY